jgi:hypothetical protein
VAKQSRLCHIKYVCTELDLWNDKGVMNGFRCNVNQAQQAFNNVSKAEAAAGRQ